MQVYKITFSNNEVLACTLFYGRDIEGQYSCEHHNGYLIYALVKASSEEEALKISQKIIVKFLEGRLGSVV
jgi:hypothetical protein